MLFLDSARRHRKLGRYSFLTADPFDYFEVAADGSDGLAVLAQRIAPFAAHTIPDLPPFQGGAAGLFGYDLSRSLERTATAESRRVPNSGPGHRTVRRGAGRRSRRPKSLDHLAGVSRNRARCPSCSCGVDDYGSFAAGSNATSQSPRRCPRLPGCRYLTWRRSSRCRDPQGLTSNFSAEGYLTAIRRAIEYIHAGDIFQVNIAQRLLYPCVRQRRGAVSSIAATQRRRRLPATSIWDARRS